MLNRALRLLRTYHQLSQTVLATKLGISNSYLSEIESGKKTAGIELLNQYAALFGMPVSSILLFSESLNQPGGASQRVQAYAASKILTLLEWIDDSERVESSK